MISFVHTEPEVTLKIDCVVYSDDNLFPHTRNCLTNVIFWLHALCHLHALQSKTSSQCILSSLFQSVLRVYTARHILHTPFFCCAVYIKFNLFVNKNKNRPLTSASRIFGPFVSDESL